jgi:hypothetical protein
MRSVKTIILPLIILTQVTSSYPDYDIDSYEAKYEAFLEAVRTRDGEAATLLYRELLWTKGVKYFCSEDVTAYNDERSNKGVNTEGRRTLQDQYFDIYWDYGQIYINDEGYTSMAFFDYCILNGEYYAGCSAPFNVYGIDYDGFELFCDNGSLTNWYNFAGYDNYFSMAELSGPRIVGSPDYPTYNPYWFYIEEDAGRLYLRHDLISDFDDPDSVSNYSLDADITESVYPVLYFDIYYESTSTRVYYFGISYDQGGSFTFSEIFSTKGGYRSGASSASNYISNVSIGELDTNDRIYISCRWLNISKYTDNFGLDWSEGKQIIPDEYGSYPDVYIVGPLNVVSGKRDSFGVGVMLWNGGEADVYYLWTDDAGDNYIVSPIYVGPGEGGRITTSKHILNDKAYIAYQIYYEGRALQRDIFKAADISDIEDWECSVIGTGYLSPNITHGYFQGEIIPFAGINYTLDDSTDIAGYAYCEDYTASEDIGLVALEGENGVTVKWAETPLPYNCFNIYKRTGSYIKNNSSKGTLLNETPITGLPPYEYVDSDIETGVTYTYWLEAIDVSGVSDWYGPVTCTVGVKPYTFSLRQNRPNPVPSGTTKFVFSVPEAGEAELCIYDLSGRKVFVALDRYLEPGEYEVPFTVTLPPGVYMYRLNACGESACRKMVVLE